MAKAKPLVYQPTHFCKLSALGNFARVPSGWAAIDIYTGGGIPIGTNTLVSGMESSGKSTLIGCTIANYLRFAPKSEVLYINFDNKLQMAPLARRGADTDRIEIMFPPTAEEAQQVVEDVVRVRPTVGLVVVDSLASMSPEGEIIGGDEIAIAARMNNKWFRRMTALQLARIRSPHPLTLLIINQTRVKTGLFPVTVLPGGNQQRFQAALWVSFQKADVHYHKATGIPLAQTFHYKLQKNDGEITAHYSGETRMATTPHGPWKPGDILDHDVVWYWGKMLGLLKQKEKEPVIASWQKDRVEFAAATQRTAAAFVEWYGGKSERDVIKAGETIMKPEAGPTEATRGEMNAQAVA